MKLLKSKKGFTLMELIVGILMFSIIAIVVSTALSPTLFAYMRANDFAEYNSLLDNIANQIINDLNQSTEEPRFIAATGGAPVPPGGWAVDNTRRLVITTNTRTIAYTIRNTQPGAGGVLQREGVNATGVAQLFDVFSEDFYKRKSVSFAFAQPDPTENVFILTIRLRENSNLGNIFEIDREYAVRPLMLNQSP